MIKLATALLLSTFTAAVSAGPADDYEFPAKTDVTGPELKRCATADMQVFALVDLGDVALYLEDCEHRPFLEQPRLLHFYYGREFDADDYRQSGKKLLERNLSDKAFAELEAAIDDFNAVYQATSEGDRYAIGTNKQGQLELYLNGEYIGRSESMAFARDYFKIWFGEDPFRNNVKDSLSPPFDP